MAALGRKRQLDGQRPMAGKSADRRFSTLTARVFYRALLTFTCHKLDDGLADKVDLDISPG